MSDRYIIRESTGYTQARGPALTTEVMVLDSWYGYAVVWSSQSATYPQPQYDARGWRRGFTHRKWHKRSVGQRQKRAEEVAAELNAEHEAAMLAPMQAATVGEDATPAKGKGSR